jgi:hypothetical protein
MPEQTVNVSLEESCVEASPAAVSTCTELCQPNIPGEALKVILAGLATVSPVIMRRFGFRYARRVLTPMEVRLHVAVR